MDDMGVPLDLAYDKKYCCNPHRDHLLQVKEGWLARLKKRAELQLIAAIEREGMVTERNEFISREVLYAIADGLTNFQDLPSSVKLACLNQSMTGHNYDVRRFAKALAEEYGNFMKANVGLDVECI